MENINVRTRSGNYIRKFMCFAIITVFSLGFSACSSTSSTYENALSENEVEVENIRNQISAELPYYAPIEVDKKDEGFSVRISVDMSLTPNLDLAAFGDIIYGAIETCNTIFQDLTYDLSITQIYNGKLMYAFVTSIGDLGILYDYRMGNTKYKVYDTIDELAADFPLLKQTLNAESVSAKDEDIDRYNEIMDALSDFSRAEEEILIDLANSYRMSLDEINWFIDYVTIIKFFGTLEPSEDEICLSIIDTYAIDFDPIVFSTTAEDNGLGDSVFRITGTLEKLTAVEGYSCAKLTTEEGIYYLVASNDTFSDMHEMYPGGVLGWANWYSIDTGEEVTVYSHYLGYSEVLDGANGIFIYADLP